MSSEPESLPDPQPPAAENLLLSSLAEFWSLLEPLLAAAQPKSICEIGLGQGAFTRRLLDFCAKHSCRYCGIDAAVDGAAFARATTVDCQFLKLPSLDALPGLAAQDVYFLDGDHNYYTALNELRQITRGPERWPLIVAHDVGWPWGRRDQYCAPEAIPPEFRHGHSATLGVLPGQNELAADGFSGDTSDYKYFAADHEGGPRNGVLTAIEDFLAEPGHQAWCCLTLPGIFGLGIIYSPGNCHAPLREEILSLEKSVKTLSPFLESLERNRIALFLTHLKNIKQWGSLNGEYQKLLLAYQDLHAHYEELHRYYKLLEKSVK